MKLVRNTLIVLFTLLSASAWGTGSLSHPMYQGVLQDAAGLPLQGYHDLELHFYETPDDPRARTVVSFDAVELIDGKFTVAFEDGRADPYLPWTDGDQGSTADFLSITVDGDLATPLVPVSTDGQTVFVLPDDGDGSSPTGTSSPDAVLPSAVPAIVGEPLSGEGGDESPAGTLLGGRELSSLDRADPKSPRSVKLAEFTLPNGNVVEFIALPELGDVGVLETAPLGGGGPTIATSENVSALEIFRRLAPAGTAIPRLLTELEAARRESPGGGSDVESCDPDPMAEDASWLTSLPRQQDGLKSHCGMSGAEDFENAYCNLSNLNRFSPISFCDHHYHPSGGNTVWYSLFRNSVKDGQWRKRWNSHAVTGSCSTRVKVYHLFWGYTAFSGWQWKVNFSHVIDPGTVVYSVWYGGSKRYRRIERFRLDGTGGFRAATTFNNNV